MAVTYYLVFGSGDPSGNTGLAPTFTVFQNSAGGATTPPSISEVGSSGIYTFSYDPQGSINFVVDGATTGLSASNRYIVGALDVGDSLQNTSVGTASDGIGDSATDPTSLFAFVRRIKELLEGDQTYTKATGVFVMKDSTGATTLASKTITDNDTTVDRT